jgi:hypothetical protein
MRHDVVKDERWAEMTCTPCGLVALVPEHPNSGAGGWKNDVPDLRRSIIFDLQQRYYACCGI